MLRAPSAPIAQAARSSRSPVGRRDRRGHAAGVLRQPGQPGVEEHLRAGDLLEVAQRDRGELVLAEMDVVRVVRVVREELEVERDPLARLVHEVGVVLLAEALLLGLAQDPQPVEVLEHRPVVDHRSGRVDDVRLGLHDGDSKPALREAERRDEADRARARDQHTLVSFHGGQPTKRQTYPPSMTERFPQLAVEDLDDEQQRAIAPILEYTGSISGPFNATLRSARLTETSFTLGTYLLFETGISRRLTEIAILIGARVSGSQFEWWAHHRRALEEGVPEELCDALRRGRRPDGLDEQEGVLYDFCVEQLTAPEVSDATFERTKAVFGERGIVDLAYLLGFYGMIGGVLKVAAVTPPDGSMPLEPMEAPFAR